jgi:hypothetical protein
MDLRGRNPRKSSNLLLDMQEDYKDDFVNG